LLLLCLQGSWFKRHPVENAIDVVTAAAAELREKHAVQKVGLQG
jgi:2-methylcitrate dehydratase PrpD